MQRSKWDIQLACLVSILYQPLDFTDNSRKTLTGSYIECLAHSLRRGDHSKLVMDCNLCENMFLGIPKLDGPRTNSPCELVCGECVRASDKMQVLLSLVTTFSESSARANLGSQGCPSQAGDTA